MFFAAHNHFKKVRSSAKQKLERNRKISKKTLCDCQIWEEYSGNERDHVFDSSPQNDLFTSSTFTLLCSLILKSVFLHVLERNLFCFFVIANSL